MGSKSSWFVRPNRLINSKMRGFFFPYAGGSAITYDLWSKGLPPQCENILIQPPGRAERFTEAPHSAMEAYVDDLMPQFTALLDRPYFLFGHSLGSQVAFELLKRLKIRGYRMPLHFFASGSTAPHLPPCDGITYDLPDAKFVEKLKELDGTPKEILENSEYLELFLPMLRADFEIAESYLSPVGRLIDIPLTIFQGIDDHTVKEEGARSWSEHFSKESHFEWISGGHFFIEDQKEAILSVIRSRLSSFL